jgi:hypothetical protein
MEPNYLLRMVYGGDPLEDLDERGPIELTKAIPFDTGESSISTPITAFLAKAEKGLLVKSTGVADESWNEPLMKAVELSPEFLERSNQRLQKMRAAIEKVFVGHPQECQKAIEISRLALVDARNEALVLAGA